jgi:hypothetical protein
MASTFGDRIDALKEMVGSGDLVGTVVVDQVYARYQLPGMRAWTCTTPEVARRCTFRPR